MPIMDWTTVSTTTTTAAVFESLIFLFSLLSLS
jgi:hypothetical protein